MFDIIGSISTIEINYDDISSSLTLDLKPV